MIIKSDILDISKVALIIFNYSIEKQIRLIFYIMDYYYTTTAIVDNEQKLINLKFEKFLGQFIFSNHRRIVIILSDTDINDSDKVVILNQIINDIRRDIRKKKLEKLGGECVFNQNDNFDVCRTNQEVEL